MKLVQKQFLKGSREFEIIDDMVFVRIKSLVKEENSSVGLSTLDPEPVTTGSELVFLSRYQSRPVFSLLLNNPDAEKFNTFVDDLKQHIQNESNAHVSTEAVPPESPRPDPPGWNVYEVPTEFEESDEGQTTSPAPPVNSDRVDQDITMLKTYMNEDDISPLLDALEALKTEPQNDAAFQKVISVFNDLGFNQGAVLTYAPYLKVLLSQSLRL
jgi:hypothetical protein